MARYFGDRSRCRGVKQLAFDRYGAIEVHNLHVERLVLGGEFGNGGPRHRLQFHSTETQKRVPIFKNSNECDIHNFLDKFTDVRFYDFLHVYEALHCYRVPLQGPILAFQGTDPSRAVSQCGSSPSSATRASKLFFKEIASFCVAIVFEIAIIVTMFFYYKIANKLRQWRTFLMSMQPPGTQGTRDNADRQPDYQLMTVVVSTTFILIITVLPYVVARHILHVRRLFTAAHDDPRLQLFFDYYWPVQLTNFVLNPIVYAWRLPNYRLALLRALQCR